MTRPSSLILHPSSPALETQLRGFVIGLLLIAFFFRTHELAGLGLGLEHDEVAEWLIADGIRHGQHALFFTEAYGQEPLFLYLMTGSITWIGDNVFGVRFASVFVAMLTLAAAHRLLRRMFSPTVALAALAGMSIALWPVFWGRVGLRAMTLPLTMCLGFDYLWRGLTSPGAYRLSPIAYRLSLIAYRLSLIVPRRPASATDNEAPAHPRSPSLLLFAWAGLFVGLSAYTYLAARAIPILVLAFVLYLALFARDRMRGRWPNIVVFLGVGTLVALPLAFYLLANPDLQFRVSEVSRPLDQALAGDPTELTANIPRAFGMFTIQGDGSVRDNWPDRPVFPEPAGALLFNFGFLIALTRMRQPRYALALIWIGAMLIPTIVTAGTPNFTRTLGALPMVFALPGIAVEWLAFWPQRLIAIRNLQTASRVLRPIFVLGLVGVFGANAASTYDDYFNKWPAHPETQFVFQSDLAAIAHDIDASEVMDVAVGGLSNDTLDDPSLYLLRRRKDVRVRWFDSGSPISSGGAVVHPHGASAGVYIPSIVPLASELEKYLVHTGSLVVAEQFNLYRVNWAYDDDPSVWMGRYFEDSAILLLANQSLPHTISAGQNLRFETRWLARQPIAYPRRIFAHLIDPKTGRIVAQHDGLDSPTKFWHPYDWIAQVHTLSIPAGTPPAKYELRIGLYDPATGARVLQTDYSRSEPPSDHFVLGTIEVIR